MEALVRCGCGGKADSESGQGAVAACPGCRREAKRMFRAELVRAYGWGTGPLMHAASLFLRQIWFCQMYGRRGSSTGGSLPSC